MQLPGGDGDVIWYHEEEFERHEHNMDQCTAGTTPESIGEADAKYLLMGGEEGLSAAWETIAKKLLEAWTKDFQKLRRYRIARDAHLERHRKTRASESSPNGLDVNVSEGGR